MPHVYLFGFVLRRYPFGGKSSGNAISLARSIIRDKLQWPSGEGEFDNPEIKKLIERLLDKNSRTRLTASEALALPLLQAVDTPVGVAGEGFPDDYSPASPVGRVTAAAPAASENAAVAALASPRKRANTLGEAKREASKSVLNVAMTRGQQGSENGRGSNPGAKVEDVEVLTVRTPTNKKGLRVETQ